MNFEMISGWSVFRNAPAHPDFGFWGLVSEAQSWRKRNMTHRCSHARAPASTHASAHASVHESAHKSWLSLCVIIPYKGSHSSAHAGAHASAHEVVWSYVTWSVSRALFLTHLVSHYSAFGDAISCSAPIARDRLQRQAFSALPPLLSLSLDRDRPFSRKEVGV